MDGFSVLNLGNELDTFTILSKCFSSLNEVLWLANLRDGDIVNFFLQDEFLDLHLISFCN